MQPASRRALSGGAARLHEWNNVLRAQKSSTQIGLDDAVPKIFGHKADTRPTRDAPVKVGNDASVVDQHVDLTVAVHDLMNHAAHLVLVAHVRGPAEPAEVALLAEALEGARVVESAR